MYAELQSLKLKVKELAYLDGRKFLVKKEGEGFYSNMGVGGMNLNVDGNLEFREGVKNANLSLNVRNLDIYSFNKITIDTDIHLDNINVYVEDELGGVVNIIGKTKIELGSIKGTEIQITIQLKRDSINYDYEVRRVLVEGEL